MCFLFNFQLLNNEKLIFSIVIWNISLFWCRYDALVISANVPPYIKSAIALCFGVYQLKSKWVEADLRSLFEEAVPEDNQTTDAPYTIKF